MSGKRYTEEFKKETVKHILEKSYTVSSVSQRLGLILRPPGNRTAG